MRLLCELNDLIVLGQNETNIFHTLSDQPPRLTARAIVRNQSGLYAVMYSDKFGLHSLPGGGIEDGENVLTALRREILEETGSICHEIQELGIVYEYRSYQNYAQKSYYYVVTTSQETQSLHLTASELEDHTVVQWHTFATMLHLISSPNHTTNQRKYIQARDMAALEAYQIWYPSFIPASCQWDEH